MIPVDEIKERALRHPGDFALWSTCAEICERLDAIIERLDRLIDASRDARMPLPMGRQKPKDK